METEDNPNNRDESSERDHRLMNPDNEETKDHFTPDSNERTIRADED